MRAKDKKRKYLKITIKNIIYMATSLIVLVQLLIFYHVYLGNHQSYAKETSMLAENIEISKAPKVDMDMLIAETIGENRKEEFEVKQEVLEYITKYQSNSNLPKGTVQVIQEGRQGIQEITTKKTYENGELVQTEQIDAKVVRASIHKIVEVGDGNWTSQYKVKVGDKVFVTSDRLGVMVEANETSQKIATLSKGEELTVQEVLGDWYKIISGTTRRICKN